MNVISRIVAFIAAGLMLGTGTVHAQNHVVSAQIDKLPDQMVYLGGFFKDGIVILDSMRSANGQVYFVMPEEEDPGTAWLFFGAPGPDSRRGIQPDFIEFLYDREDIGIFATYPDLKGSVRFSGSPQNSLYIEYKMNEEEYHKKLEVLNTLLDTYPARDEYYTFSVKYYEALQKARDAGLLAFEKNYPDTYLARLVESARMPLVPGDLDAEGRTTFLKEHFFDIASLSDPAMLTSPVYNKKIIDYLTLYMVKTSPEEQEKAYLEAVDVIMASTSSDPLIRNFVVEYLFNGFEMLQMEEVQTYLADNYVDENCQSDIVEIALQRIEGYRKMAIGQIAPDIVIRDSRNRTIRLSGSEHEYTAVIFWASYCEHCQKLIPRLADWYNTKHDLDLDILAVSIDTVKNDWSRFITAYKLPWTNAIETAGWNGKTASDYNVYATPTIFILDRNRKILAKPYTYREFIRETEKLKKTAQVSR
ncbi:MAG: thioredoxin-like domain-containing protein [Bacteroidota bacterium]